MSRERIQHLEELLKPHIVGKKILSFSISRLTAPGDNYGGLLLKVDVTLEDTKGVQEELNVVAKCIPVNEFMQKIFNIQVTCKNEIAFYSTIVPLLQEFQREHGLDHVADFFPKLYGARINLNGSDVVDENAAIIMENLVHSGYKNINRLIGFDLETTKLILQNLATFHAVPLALRLARPDVFEQKIKPYLSKFRPPSPPPSGNGSFPRGPDVVLTEFLETCEEVRSLLPALTPIINRKVDEEEVLGPFTTVAHADAWVNNIMVKFENDKPAGVKFVDFQNLQLRSPAADLLFFLWSSIQNSLLEKVDDLIQFYYENFIENLKQFDCDLTPFSFEDFLEELKTESKLVLSQSLFMVTFVVLSKKGGFAVDESSSAPPDLGSVDDITPEAKERVVSMIKNFHKKGWLN